MQGADTEAFNARGGLLVLLDHSKLRVGIIRVGTFTQPVTVPFHGTSLSKQPTSTLPAIRICTMSGCPRDRDRDGKGCPNLLDPAGKFDS